MIFRSIRPLVLISTLFAWSGCREVEPPPEHYADLGDSGHALLPTPGELHDTRVKTGQAEWKTFQPPDAKKSKDTGGKPGKDGEEGAGAAPEPSKEEILNDVRDTIEDYNKAIAAKEYDKAVDFHVPAQRESAKTLYETRKSVEASIGELKQALIEKLPDQKDKIEATFGAMIKDQSTLDVTGLTYVSATEVDGQLPVMPPMPSMIKFRLLQDPKDQKDYWYIESPLLSDLDKFRPMIEAQKMQLSMAATQVKAGALPADQFLKQLESTVEMTKNLSKKPADNAEGAAKNDAEGDAPAKPEKTGE